MKGILVSLAFVFLISTAFAGTTATIQNQSAFVSGATEVHFIVSNPDSNNLIALIEYSGDSSAILGETSLLVSLSSAVENLNCTFSPSDSNKFTCTYSWNTSGLGDASGVTLTVKAKKGGETAFDGIGTTAGFSVDNTVPAKVSIIAADVLSTSSIRLTWNANTESDLNYYKVYRNGSNITNVPAGTNFYTDTGLSSGLGYTYRVSAVDESGKEGEKSGEVSATTESDTPSNKPNISSDTHDEADWTQDDDPEFDWSYSEESGFDHYRYSLNDQSDYDIEDDSSKDEYNIDKDASKSKSYSNLNEGEYWFHVASCNSSNECGETDSFRIRIDKTGPEQPKNISGIVQSDNSVYLYWDEPKDRPLNKENSGVKEYIVYRSNKKDFSLTDYSTKKFDGITKRSFTADDKLTKGIAYYYKVQAVDNAGNNGTISSEHKVLLSQGDCTLEISIDVPENAPQGELEINASVSGGSIIDADLKIKMPTKAYETLLTNQSGTGISETYGISEGISGEANILLSGEDDAGNICEKIVTFNVDSIKPELEIIFPENGDMLIEDSLISASASDEGTGISKVEAYVGNTLAGTLVQKTSAYELEWNSRLKENGDYTLQVVAEDKAGNKTVKEINVTLNNVIGEIVVEKEYSYDVSQLGEKLKSAGVKDEVLAEAKQLTEQFSPKRKLIITKTEAGFNAVISIEVKNKGDATSVQLVENIPKEMAQNAGLIESDFEFDVLNNDPIIKFDLGSVLKNEEVKISYSVGTGLSEQRVNELENALAKYLAPPIIIGQDKTDAIAFNPLPDWLWIAFIGIGVLFILFVIIVFLGGGALLLHYKRKNGGFGKKKGFFEGISGKSGDDEKGGKFSYRE